MPKTYIAGVGMTKFIKPRGNVSYEEMGCEAIVKALIDAGITYDDVQFALAAFCYGESCCGQRVLYQLGTTGIPIINVNNNCSTGSTALYQARSLISSGAYDCILCIGFEKMERGSLQTKWTDRTHPVGKHTDIMKETRFRDTSDKTPYACEMFGNAGMEYCEKYEEKANVSTLYDSMARIAEYNHRHSANNPYSQFKDVYTLEEIKSSPVIHGSITKLQCCPTSDGAAAAVLVSEKFLNSHPHLKNQAIEIAGQVMVTDTGKTFARKSAIDLIGYDMTKKAARAAFEQAGITPEQIRVVELHDCFSANQLIAIDALGLSKAGQACKLVNDGDITYSGKYLINPSGGLEAKGHALGATGIAQCSELVWHLRGWATNRSVPNTRYCLQHNIGLGGAVVVSIYKRPDESNAPHQQASSSRDDGRSRLGYNPALEARPITLKMLRSVQARDHDDYVLKGLALYEEAHQGSHL